MTPYLVHFGPSLQFSTLKRPMLSLDHSARFGLVMVGRVLSKIPDFVTTNTAGVRYVSTKVSRGFTLTFFKTPFPPVVPGLVAAVPPSCYITTIPCTSRREGQPIHVCCERVALVCRKRKTSTFYSGDCAGNCQLVK